MWGFEVQAGQGFLLRIQVLSEGGSCQFILVPSPEHMEWMKVCDCVSVYAHVCL